MSAESPELAQARLATVAEAHTSLRRVWHVAGGLVILAPYALGLLARPLYVAGLAVVLAGLLVTDVARLVSVRANALFVRLFRSLLLPRDVRGLNGTTYFVAGILIAVLLFPKGPAVAGALYLILGDFAAGLVGRRWGRTRFKPAGKSLEGSAACFVVCFAAALPLVSWKAALAGALAATVIEHANFGLDDNLLIPPLGAAVTTWVG